MPAPRAVASLARISAPRRADLLCSGVAAAPPAGGGAPELDGGGCGVSGWHVLIRCFLPPFLRRHALLGILLCSVAQRRAWSLSSSLCSAAFIAPWLLELMGRGRLRKELEFYGIGAIESDR